MLIYSVHSCIDIISVVDNECITKVMQSYELAIFRRHGRPMLLFAGRRCDVGGNFCVCRRSITASLLAVQARVPIRILP